MRLRAVIVTLLGLALALPLSAQYRDDQFKRDAFTQNYADTTEKTAADTSQLFSFKEYFGGLAHKRSASLKTLTMGSAVFVGGSQIYNRDYWKLPVVYGGIGAGVGAGIYFNNQYKATGDDKYHVWSNLSYIGAGLVWWGSLLDGAVGYEKGKYPNPAKSTVYSILLPGLGQIYNHRYWKLPIVVGAFVGLTYATSWNNRMLNDYTKGYRDLMDSDPGTKSYMDFFPPTVKESDLDIDWLKKTLKNKKNYYRRYKEICIISIVAVYLINIVDAYVDASLAHFDISDNLTMNVGPAAIAAPQLSRWPSLGMHLGFNF